MVLELGIVGVVEFWRLLDIAIYRGIYFNIFSFELGLKWATMGHAVDLKYRTTEFLRPGGGAKIL